MDTFLLITISGLGLGSLYFLLSSGLSLIFGLMRVLSFAHGAFLTVSAYVAYLVMSAVEEPTTAWLALVLVLCSAVGGLLALLTEVLVVRRLPGKEFEQLLATVGIGTVLVAYLFGVFGPDQRTVELPGWLTSTTDVFGASVPNNRLLLIVAAVLVLIGIRTLLGRTRYGLVIRAGVENSEMVSALGINVGRAFTTVFTFGGVLAGLGGAMAAVYFRGIDPTVGDGMLIFAFIVLIIGGLGSIDGAAIAAVFLGVTQSLVNFYVDLGLGDVFTVVLLMLTLLVRPQGILGQKEQRLV